MKAVVTWPAHMAGQEVEIVNSPAAGVFNTILPSGEAHVFNADNLDMGTPVGLTGLEPMAYGQTRWNGSVWPDIQVDSYNRLLADIASKHRAGMDTQNLIDGLYNLAHGFDTAGKGAATD